MPETEAPRIYQLVVDGFEALGATDPKTIRRAVIFRERTFAGQRFHCDCMQAIWLAVGIGLVASLAPLMQKFAGFGLRKAKFPDQDDRQLEAVTAGTAVALALLGCWLFRQPRPPLLDPLRDADINVANHRFVVGRILRLVPEFVLALVR